MKIKRIIKDDISNGPGIRVSTFLGFCPGVIWNKKTKRYDHCPGCFNSEAWADSGTPLKDCIDDIINYLKPSYVAGLSILGGEPLCKENQPIVYNLIKTVKKVYGNTKNIWCWTGYIFTKNIFNKNRIPHTKYTKYILKNINVLIDGPFIANKFNIDLKYKGSSNQRVLHLN